MWYIVVKNAKAKSRKIGFYLILNLHVLHLLNCYSKKLLNFTMLKVKMCGHKSCIVMSRLLNEMCVTCLHMHKMYYICMRKTTQAKTIFQEVYFSPHKRLIPVKFNRGTESMFSNLLQIFTFYLFLWEKYCLKKISFIAQFSFTLWLFKLLGIIRKFPF